MSSPRLSRGWSIGLLLGLFLVVGLVLALMGSAVMLPQGAVVGVLLVAATLFLGAQLALFRAFGLRSQADEDPGAARGGDAESTGESTGEDDADWRAWRG